MDIPMHPRPVGEHADPRLTAEPLEREEDSTPIIAQDFEHIHPPPQYYAAPPQPVPAPAPTPAPAHPFEMFGTSNPWLIVAVIFLGGFFLGKSMQTIVVKSG